MTALGCGSLRPLSEWGRTAATADPVAHGTVPRMQQEPTDGLFSEIYRHLKVQEVTDSQAAAAVTDLAARAVWWANHLPEGHSAKSRLEVLGQALVRLSDEMRRGA